MDPTLPALFGYHLQGVLVAFAIAAAPPVMIALVLRVPATGGGVWLKAAAVALLVAVWLAAALPYALVCLAFSQEGPPFI